MQSQVTVNKLSVAVGIDWVSSPWKSGWYGMLGNSSRHGIVKLTKALLIGK